MQKIIKKNRSELSERRILLFYINFELEFVKLRLVKRTGSIKHDVASGVVLGECDAVTDAVQACKDAYKAVQTECQTTVRRCTELDGVHQEAEFGLSLLWCKA